MAKRMVRRDPPVTREADESKCTHTFILSSGLRAKAQVIEDGGVHCNCILFLNGFPIGKTRWIPRARLKPIQGTTDTEGKS